MCSGPKSVVFHLSRLDAVAPERDCAPTIRPQKNKTSGSHLWRLSNPPSKAPLLLDRETCLQKSHSAQNLASDCTFHHHSGFFYYTFATVSLIMVFEFLMSFVSSISCTLWDTQTASRVYLNIIWFADSTFSFKYTK